VFDCIGVCDGSAVEDECGVCDGIYGYVAGSCYDCAGVPNGLSYLDECGGCDANVNNDCIQDCADIWGGNAVEDECGICDGNGCYNQDCTTYPQSYYDCNGNCDIEDDADLNGLCDGQLEIDNNNYPGEFNIRKIYPNPFNPVLNININLAWAGMTQVNILDIAGGHIKTLHSGFLKSGSHELSWHAESMPSGLYFISLKLGNKNLTEKVVLLK
jgi:hypothetical protein